MLTTALRPFHILDSMDDLMEDVFFPNEHSPRSTAGARFLESRRTVNETQKGILITTTCPGRSAKDLRVKMTTAAVASLTAPSFHPSIAIHTTNEKEKQPPILFKLPRKSGFDAKGARAYAYQGFLRVAVPKITKEKKNIPVIEGTFEKKEVSDSEVKLSFKIPGFASNEVTLTLDADNENIEMFVQLGDKSRQFHRKVSVPRTLTPEHVSCFCANGLLELRIKDPSAIEARTIEILPNQPMAEEGKKEEKKPISLMRHEVPGFSWKDVECILNSDQTIEARRGDRRVKIGIPNTIDVSSIRAYCEHGIFELLADKIPDLNPNENLVKVEGPTSEEEKNKLQNALESIVLLDDEEEPEEDAVLVNKKK